MKIFNQEIEKSISLVELPLPSKLLFWGDTVTLRPGGFVGMLEAMLGENHAPAGFEIMATGTPDNTTESAWADIDGVLAGEPSHIFIMLGLNDSLPDPRTRVARRDISSYTQGYSRIIETLKSASGALLFQMTTSAVVPELAGRQGWTEILEQYNAEVRKLAKESATHLIDIFEVFARNEVKDLLEPDGFSPNINGHKLIALAILEYLGSL